MAGSVLTYVIELQTREGSQASPYILFPGVFLGFVAVVMMSAAHARLEAARSASDSSAIPTNPSDKRSPNSNVPNIAAESADTEPLLEPEKTPENDDDQANVASAGYKVGV